MGGRGSTGLSLFIFALIVAFVLVVIYFDLEWRFLGYRYSEWMWRLVRDIALSIPKMLDHLLDTIRRA